MMILGTTIDSVMIYPAIEQQNTATQQLEEHSVIDTGISKPAPWVVLQPTG